MGHIPQIDKAISRKKNKAGGITLPTLKLYCEDLGIDQYVMDQWNRIESPEINPHTYDRLTCNKGDKNIQKRKRDSLP